MRSLLDPAASTTEDGVREFFAADPEELFDRSQRKCRWRAAPARRRRRDGLGGGAGVPFVGDLLGGVQAPRAASRTSRPTTR